MSVAATSARSLPPERMPLVRHGRLLKRWRYVAAFAPDVMVAVADVHVGPLRQRFFAVAEPDGRLVTADSLWRRAVTIDGARVIARSRRVAIDLELDEDAGVATLHPAGAGGYVWTRKQAGVPVRGTVTVDGRARNLACRGVVDDTAGYHARHTAWRWSAGVGTARDGRAVAWNLVHGVNDAPTGSERRVWIDGVPAEVGPVEFAPDLSGVRFAEGGELRLEAWAERAARANALVVRSSYRQPFGTFSGELPGAGELGEGYGVMEWHEAVW